MVSRPLLWPFLSSLVFISVTFFLSLNASAITTATAASCRWTPDVIQPSSLGSGPAAAVIKEFHTAQTTALCITVANIAPISFLKVPLRSSSADLHICGTLAAIRDHTRPHAPLKDSATLITRLHALPRVGAWSADIIIFATSALASSASTDLLTSSSFVDRWPIVDRWLFLPLAVDFSSWLFSVQVLLTQFFM